MKHICIIFENSLIYFCAVLCHDIFHNLSFFVKLCFYIGCFNLSLRSDLHEHFRVSYVLLIATISQAIVVSCRVNDFIRLDRLWLPFLARVLQVSRSQPLRKNADNATRCDTLGGNAASTPTTTVLTRVNGDADSVQAAPRVFALSTQLVFGSLDTYDSI